MLTIAELEPPTNANSRWQVPKAQNNENVHPSKITNYKKPHTVSLKGGFRDSGNALVLSYCTVAIAELEPPNQRVPCAPHFV